MTMRHARRHAPSTSSFQIFLPCAAAPPPHHPHRTTTGPDGDIPWTTGSLRGPPGPPSLPTRCSRSRPSDLPTCPSTAAGAALMRASLFLHHVYFLWGLVADMQWRGLARDLLIFSRTVTDSSGTCAHADRYRATIPAPSPSPAVNWVKHETSLWELASGRIFYLGAV